MLGLWCSPQDINNYLQGADDYAVSYVPLSLQQYTAANRCGLHPQEKAFFSLLALLFNDRAATWQAAVSHLPQYLLHCCFAAEDRAFPLCVQGGAADTMECGQPCCCLQHTW